MATDGCPDPDKSALRVHLTICISDLDNAAENQRSFTNSTFTVKTDDRGIKFVEMVAGETTNKRTI
jgi:hypothetical protein